MLLLVRGIHRAAHKDTSRGPCLAHLLRGMLIPLADRPPESRGLREPRPLGGRAGQADRGHPAATPHHHHPCVVRRVRPDRGRRAPGHDRHDEAPRRAAQGREGAPPARSPVDGSEWWRRPSRAGSRSSRSCTRSGSRTRSSSSTRRSSTRGRRGSSSCTSGSVRAAPGAGACVADVPHRRRLPAPAHPEFAVRDRPADAGHGHDRGELHVPGACDARRLASRAC
jgi:hypothetical protein